MKIVQFTAEQRQQAENYATSIGYSDVQKMSDERLQRMMQDIADDCKKYGCD